MRETGRSEIQSWRSERERSERERSERERSEREGEREEREREGDIGENEGVSWWLDLIIHRSKNPRTTTTQVIPRSLAFGRRQ